MDGSPHRDIGEGSVREEGKKAIVGMQNIKKMKNNICLEKTAY